eukprot:3644502-Pleurochrysis_carterae.AAC.2
MGGTLNSTWQCEHEQTSWSGTHRRGVTEQRCPCCLTTLSVLPVAFALIRHAPIDRFNALVSANVSIQIRASETAAIFVHEGKAEQYFLGVSNTRARQSPPLLHEMRTSSIILLDGSNWFSSHAAAAARISFISARSR